MPSTCEICGKRPLRGNKVRIARSHVSRRVKRFQQPNIRRVKVVENGVHRHVYACTECIRSGRLTRS